MWNTLIRAVFAGVMIGIGGTVYIGCSNSIVGAFLFTIGLFVILLYDFNLFTGKVGYFIGAKNKKEFFINLVIIWVGNFIGSGIYATGLKNTSFVSVANLTDLYTYKINQPLFSVLFLSVACGILMFIAVDNFRTNQSDTGKYLGLFLCIPTFILCKFEHSIANMFYLLLNDGVLSISGKAFIFIIICTAGNSIGGLLIPAFRLTKSAR